MPPARYSVVILVEEANAAMTYIVMAYIGMAYIVMAYSDLVVRLRHDYIGNYIVKFGARRGEQKIVMANIVMALAQVHHLVSFEVLENRR